MKTAFLRALPLVAAMSGLVSTSALAASSTAADVIAKAREFLGGDAALDAVNSIRFSGTIFMQDGTSGDIEILARKPMQQRITITIGNIREITALSGYDGWRKVENLRQAGDWELTLLNAPQIQRLRANTIENIGFFNGLPGARPDVELVAEETIDGVEVARIAFKYTGRVQFLRTFDKATGRLVRTVTEDGGVLTEEGEIVVQGVRFPKKLVTRAEAGTSTVSFTRIQLNEAFEDALFDVPMLMPGAR